VPVPDANNTKIVIVIVIVLGFISVEPFAGTKRRPQFKAIIKLQAVVLKTLISLLNFSQIQ
jgi:uncharacterized membrane protein